MWWAGRLSRLLQWCVQFGVGSNFFLYCAAFQRLLSRQEASQTRVVGQFWLKLWLTFANGELGRWWLRKVSPTLSFCLRSWWWQQLAFTHVRWNVDGRRVDHTNRSDNSKDSQKTNPKTAICQYLVLLHFYSKSCSGQSSVNGWDEWGKHDRQGRCGRQCRVVLNSVCVFCVGRQGCFWFTYLRVSYKSVPQECPIHKSIVFCC